MGISGGVHFWWNKAILLELYAIDACDSSLLVNNHVLKLSTIAISRAHFITHLMTGSHLFIFTLLEMIIEQWHKKASKLLIDEGSCVEKINV